jgi:phosphoglycerate dehydrogenase-like enzyme
MTDRPFVVSLLHPMKEDHAFEQQIRVDPRIEVHWTRYRESSDVRTSKERNDGRDPQGLPTPQVSDATRAVWARSQCIVALDLPGPIAEVFPSLEFVQGIGAGYSHVDVHQLAALGIEHANARGLASVSIAEFVMGRLLQIWKRLPELDEHQGAHRWEPVHGAEVAGMTLGIIGLGGIGREIAKRASAFGMRTLATRASAVAGESDPDVDELLPADHLDEVLPRCDAVVVAVPTTPSTIDLFDSTRFALMRPGALFCNVARGAQVVEQDLCAALHGGHLGAAIIDVTRHEPLPADDPLWNAPNIFLSSHSAVSLDRYDVYLAELVAENLRRFLDGKPIVNRVHPD